jgi:RNA ligase
MNFYTQIGLTHEEFTERYENTGLVERHHHHEFPLDILSYSRKCVQENVWDKVTSICRGIIITRGADGGEVIARPFEKFHNYGEEPGRGDTTYLPTDEPIIWEKLDGFMCTLYEWEGTYYIASKSSFHSTHAKWATKWYQRAFPKGKGVPEWPKGFTPVFEGIMPDLRIVVNYGKREQLVLLALINIETGEELSPEAWGEEFNLDTPKRFGMTLEQAKTHTLREHARDVVDEEGYVLTWYRPGMTPFRLKMKFIEYLRLHRLVTNVSPKHIWEVLRDGLTSEMDEYLNNSTPWFAKFAQKWTKAMTAEYKRLENEALTRYQAVVNEVETQFLFTSLDQLHAARRAFALAANTPENKPYSSIMFAMLDGKNVAPIIWQRVRPMTKDANPLVNGFD